MGDGHRALRDGECCRRLSGNRRPIRDGHGRSTNAAAPGARGAAVPAIAFEIAGALSISANGNLTVRFGSPKFGPQLSYPAPTAFQDTPSGRVSRTVNFTAQDIRFGFDVQGLDTTLPLQIELKVGTPAYTTPPYAAPIQFA